jgi:hypothetical protein
MIRMLKSDAHWTGRRADGPGEPPAVEVIAVSCWGLCWLPPAARKVGNQSRPEKMPF